MYTTTLENVVRFETNFEAMKATLIEWLDNIMKGHIEPDDLREQAGIVLDSLLKMPEHVCKCDHDEDEIDELKFKVDDLSEKLDNAKEDLAAVQDELDTALAALEKKAAA